MLTSDMADPAGYKTLEVFSRAPALNKWLYERISDFIRGQILEVGSGIGNISGILLEHHQKVTLSDFRPEYCQILEQKFGLHPHLQSIRNLDLSLTDFKIQYAQLLEKFDTVIALNVMEHLPDDFTALINAASMLRGQGKLVILVPAFPGLYNILDRELGHYRRYTKSGLIKLITSAGLQYTGSSYFNATAIPGWWFSGSLQKDKIITPGKLYLYNRFVPLFRLLDKLISPFAGISLISIGIKNLN